MVGGDLTDAITGSFAGISQKEKYKSPEEDQHGREDKYPLNDLEVTRLFNAETREVNLPVHGLI